MENNFTTPAYARVGDTGYSRCICDNPACGLETLNNAHALPAKEEVARAWLAAVVGDSVKRDELFERT